MRSETVLCLRVRNWQMWIARSLWCERSCKIRVALGTHSLPSDRPCKLPRWVPLRVSQRHLCLHLASMDQGLKEKERARARKTKRKGETKEKARATAGKEKADGGSNRSVVTVDSAGSWAIWWLMRSSWREVAVHTHLLSTSLVAELLSHQWTQLCCTRPVQLHCQMSCPRSVLRHSYHSKTVLKNGRRVSRIDDTSQMTCRSHS